MLCPEKNVVFLRLCQPINQIWEREKREENESSAVGGFRFEAVHLEIED